MDRGSFVLKPLSRATLALAAGLALLLPCAAQAEMRLTDLTKVDTSGFAAPKWAVRKESARLTLACTSCSGFSAVDVQLSAAPGGMEERIRSGQTTAATMLKICRDNAAKTGTECFGLKASNLKKAVGFVSDVKISEGTYSTTYTLYQDGRMLLMRSVAGSREEAKANGGLALRKIAAQVVR